MLTLPPVRPALLKSFWLVFSLAAGLLSSLCLWLLSPLSHWSFVVSTLGTVALAGWGLCWPRMAYKVYRIYNILARRIAHIGSFLIMSICFYIVLVAVGRKESSLLLARPLALQSLWVTRQPLAKGAYKNQHPIVTSSSPRQQGWITALCSWAVRSGNAWACYLLPFFGLLSLLGDEQDNTVPADLYTLF